MSSRFNWKVDINKRSSEAFLVKGPDYRLQLLKRLRRDQNSSLLVNLIGLHRGHGGSISVYGRFKGCRVNYIISAINWSWSKADLGKANPVEIFAFFLVRDTAVANTLLSSGVRLSLSPSRP